MEKRRGNQLKLKNGVDRIEAMGNDAVVVGTNGRDLDFTPVRLGDAPEVRKSYVRKDASQGELRSHGFFYKPDGTDSGIIGLRSPVGAAPVIDIWSKTRRRSFLSEIRD